MARIAGIDLPKNKNIEIALTYIHGIGRSMARKVLQMAQVDLMKKTDVLTDGRGGQDPGGHRSEQSEDRRRPAAGNFHEY